MCEFDVAVSSLDDDGLRERVLALGALADQVEAARLAALAEWDSRAVWAVDGAASGASWLAAQGNVARGVAASALRAGRKLATMRIAGEAVASGTLAPAKGRLLAGVVNIRTEAAFARDEEVLVAQLRHLTVDDAAKVLRRWAMLADADGPRPDDHEHDTASCSQTLALRFQIDANLDTECGTIFAGVLDSIVDEYRRMARRASGAKPGSGQRPLIWVVAPRDAMVTGTGIAEIPGVGPLPALDACRMACEADVTRILTDDDGRLVFARADGTEITAPVIAA